MAYGELNETQITLLNCLIYIDDVVKHDEGENVTVGDVVDDLLKNNGKNLDKNKDPDGEYPATIPRERWIEILKAIQGDEQLCNLTITHPVNFKKDGYIEVDGEQVKCYEGMRAATFVDKTTNSATVVYRGTGSGTEWDDNGKGGYLSDTPQQEAALAYIKSLKEYENITVTGHSKGGNKAMYVAILSEEVDRCVALDGQGFSNEFCEKYEEEIAKNKHKIKSIASSSGALLGDPVKGLLISIAETEEYRKNAIPFW